MRVSGALAVPVERPLVDAVDAVRQSAARLNEIAAGLEALAANIHAAAGRGLASAPKQMEV